MNKESQETFIYRPPNVSNSNIPKTHNATLGVKFAQRQVFLNPWASMLLGKTRWQRIIFRLKHPIAYSNRSLRKIYRRVRRLFIKDRIIKCVPRKEK